MSQFKTEKAVFIGVVLEKGGERKVQEYLDELQFLAETAGAIGDKMFMQRMDRPDKATYIGTGKLQEINKNAGGTSSLSIYVAPARRHVDALGAAARRHGHPRRYG